MGVRGGAEPGGLWGREESMKEEQSPEGATGSDHRAKSTHHQREFFIDNLLVRIHFIIVMFRRSGLLFRERERFTRRVVGKGGVDE